MSLRRTKYLEEMYRKIARPSELAKLEELYASRSKGIATVMMIRRIYDVFMYYVEKYPLPGKTEMKTQENAPSPTPVFNRTIRINVGGNTILEQW